jgi:protein-disulfide isomerase
MRARSVLASRRASEARPPMNHRSIPRVAARRLASLLGVVAFGALVLLGPPAPAQVIQITPAGRAEILAHPATPYAGAANGDVTVVEYLDFNCPYCRKTAVSLGQLIAAEPKVRVLYKDWPIFGGVSVYAARAALAANWQDRYLAAHNILIDSPVRLASEAQVRERLTLAGVDLARLDRDLAGHGGAIDEILARNDEEARALTLTGTPGLVIGDYIVPGALDVDKLRQLVALARKP